MKKLVLYLLVSACLPTYAQKKKTKVAKPVTVLDYFLTKGDVEYIDKEGNTVVYRVSKINTDTILENESTLDCCTGGSYDEPYKYYMYNTKQQQIKFVKEVARNKKVVISSAQKSKNIKRPPRYARHISHIIVPDKNDVYLMFPPKDKTLTLNASQYEPIVVYNQWLNGKIKDTDTNDIHIERNKNYKLADYFINRLSSEFICIENYTSEEECMRKKQLLAEKNKQDSVSMHFIVKKIPMTRTFSWEEINLPNEVSAPQRCIVVTEKWGRFESKKYYAYKLGLVRSQLKSEEYSPNIHIRKY